MPGLVTSKWTLDTAEFDGPLKRTTDLSTASGRAISLSAKNAATAQALAAKLGADAVSEQALRTVAARQKEMAASSDFRKAQELNKLGYQGEAGGANLVAAALQRLTAAKLEVANASKVQEASMASAAVESARTLVETLALAESFNKLREAISTSLEFGEAMQRASEKTGLTVETLSVLHYAAGITGGDFENMAASVAKMDKAIGQATEGNAKAQAFLAALGLNATDLAGRSDGAEIAFRKFASTLASTENPIRRVQLAQGLLGKAGAESIPTLIQVGNNWDMFRQKASDAGVLLDTKTAGQLEATQQRLKDLEQHILGASVAFTQGFSPAFTQMMSLVAGGKTPMEEMNDLGQKLAKTFAFLGEVVYVAAAGLHVVFGVAEALVPGLGDLARKDLAKVQSLMDQAQKMHDIAFAAPGSAPAPTRIVPEQERPKGAGFEGVGDLSGAADKAAQKRLHAMVAELDQLKLQGNVSAKWEYDFWSGRIQAFAKGSSEYDTIVAKSAELAVAGARAAHEKIAQFQARQKGTPSNAEGDDIVARSLAQAQREAVQRSMIEVQNNVDSNQLAILEARNDARQREAELTDKAGNSITRYAAALELAKIHAAEFEAQMQALESIRSARALQQQAVPTRENGKALAEAQAAIVEAQGQRQIQVVQDSVAVNGRDTSGLVGATDALEEFVRATRDSASELRNLTTNVLNGFNSEVVKGISGQRTSFGDFGAGIGRDVAGAALRKGEGSILSAVGLGGMTGKKPAGTSTDPLHVMVANIQAFQGGMPQLPNLAAGLDTPLSNVPFSSLLPGGGSGSMPSVGSMLGTALSLIPGFASGGMIDPNQWAIVGEEGPELFHSGPGGHIVPNDKIGRYSGSNMPAPNDNVAPAAGDTKHYWSIDARGATDPAAVEAAVNRGIAKAAPHIAAAGVKAGKEQRMRLPSSRRG